MVFIAYLLVALGLLWLVAASVFDVKTREVPDLLSYSLIVIGLGVRGIGSLVYWRVDLVLWGLVGFGVFFILANVMYYTKQWGGGDAKLLMGLGAVFGSYLDVGLFNPELNFGFPFLIVFLINVLVVGAVYGLCWGITLGIKHRKEFLAALKTSKRSDFRNLKIAWLGFLFIAGFSVLFLSDVILFLGITLGVVVLIMAYALFFMKIVEKVGMQKWIPVGKLTEGDWLVDDVKVSKRVVCRARGLGLNRGDIVRIKRAKIKKVLVKQGIPFVPSFLIGLLISLVWGNLLVYLF